MYWRRLCLLGWFSLPTHFVLSCIGVDILIAARFLSFAHRKSPLNRHPCLYSIHGNYDTPIGEENVSGLQFKIGLSWLWRNRIVYRQTWVKSMKVSLFSLAELSHHILCRTIFRMKPPTIADEISDGYCAKSSLLCVPHGAVAVERRLEPGSAETRCYACGNVSPAMYFGETNAGSRRRFPSRNARTWRAKIRPDSNGSISILASDFRQ